ncbi:MAG TPA: hypothetical protein VHZ55_03300 [Bryobacteraceae bacterium]|jgi:hypothetical protein|nr:hypothetical protein [Bryobacteraceae bacterium]
MPLCRKFILPVSFALALLCASLSAQTFQDRINAMLNPSSGASTAEQIATMERLPDDAMKDEYAMTELRHLADAAQPAPR